MRKAASTCLNSRMFFPCPHCQFLVAYHPQSRPLPAQCPRCGKPLDEDSEAVAGDMRGTGSGHDADSGSASPFDAPPRPEPASPGLDAQVDDTPFAGIDGEAADPDSGEEAAGAAASPTNAAAFASRPPRGRWSRWQWPLVALLAVLLALQVLLADRANLAADPRWRPLVETLCNTLGCDLPAWHEPSAFTMLDRKVRPEAWLAGALRVDATFRNDARWPQAWPALQLALSDADGRVLGSRVFAPGDYLGAEPGTLLSPGQSAQVTFLVQEPSPGTVAFSFEFR